MKLQPQICTRVPLVYLRTSTSARSLLKVDLMSRRNFRNCSHMKINLSGSDETGLLRIRCADCGTPMIRRIVGNAYVYSVAPKEETP